MILFRAFHDGGKVLQKLIHPESIFLMIGVSLRFHNPIVEGFIHNFWTVESSESDPKVYE